MESAWAVIGSSVRSLAFETNRSFVYEGPAERDSIWIYLEFYGKCAAGDDRNSWSGVPFDKLVGICKILENKRII